MVGSMTATNLTLNHLLGNIASLEHHNSNVRCIVDWRVSWRRLFNPMVHPMAIGRWIRTDSSSWASESQTSVTALLIWCLQPELVAFEPLKSLIGTPLGPWPKAWWYWRFFQDTFIRWLIRVIELGLQLTPLLNRGESVQSPSSQQRI